MQDNHGQTNENIANYHRVFANHHKRPSLLYSYHGQISSSPERRSQVLSTQNYKAFIDPIKLGPHADDHAKRSHAHGIPISNALITKRNNESVYSSSPVILCDGQKSNEDLQTLKDNLLGRLQKFDTDINGLAYSLEKLKRNQSSIEQRLLKPKNEYGDTAKQKPVPVIDAIVSENQRRAKAIHAIFSKSGLNFKSNCEDIVVPLYQEPSDTEIYHKNKESFENAMRDRLKTVLKRQYRSYNARITYLSKKYDKLYDIWCAEVDKIENSAEYIEKQLKFQEIFEETFPQLRHMREEKEQFLRCENHNSSDDIPSACRISCANIYQELQEEENLMRRLAVDPPMLLDEYQQRCVFVNNNGLIRDFDSRSRIHEILRQWSAEEKKIFQEKFLQFPKNFGVIASFHERKTIQDCIEYYYLTKKKVDYKALLKKQHGKRKPKSAVAVSSTKVCKEIRLDPDASLVSTGMEKPMELPDNGLTATDSQRNTSADKNKHKRCLIQSCTTLKTKIKKLQKFPIAWFEIENSLRQEIASDLQIPPDVNHCCRRCYDRISSRIKAKIKDCETLEETDDDALKETASVSDETEVPSKECVDVTAAEENETHEVDSHKKQLEEFMKREDHEPVVKDPPLQADENRCVETESSSIIKSTSKEKTLDVMNSVSEYNSTTSCSVPSVNSDKNQSSPGTESCTASCEAFALPSSHPSSFQHLSRCNSTAFQPSLQNNSSFYPPLSSTVPSYFSAGSESVNSFYRALGAPIIPPFLLSDRFSKLDSKMRHSFLPQIFASAGFPNFLPADFSINADSSLERSRQTLVSDYLTSMSMNNGISLHIPDTFRCPQTMKAASDMRPFFMPSQKVTLLDSFQRFRSPCGISPFFEYRESYPYLKTAVDEQFSRPDILSSCPYTIPIITESYPMTSRTRLSSEESISNKKRIRLDDVNENQSTSSENRISPNDSKTHRLSFSGQPEKHTSVPVSAVEASGSLSVDNCAGAETAEIEKRPNTSLGNVEVALNEQEHESKLKQLLNRPPPDFPVVSAEFNGKESAVSRQRSYTVGSTDCRSIKKMQVIEKMSELNKRLIDEETEGPRKRTNSITKQLLTGQLPNNTVYRELNNTLKYYGSVDLNKLKLGCDNATTQEATANTAASQKNSLNLATTFDDTEAERPKSSESRNVENSNSYQHSMKKRLLQEYEKEHE